MDCETCELAMEYDLNENEYTCPGCGKVVPDQNNN